MTHSEELAKYLLEHKERLDLGAFCNWAKRVGHPVRIKSVGSKGALKINLCKQGGWEDPSAWLSNYQTECTERWKTELKRLRNVLPPEEITQVLSSQGLVDERVVQEGKSYQGEGNVQSQSSELLNTVRLGMSHAFSRTQEGAMEGKDGRAWAYNQLVDVCNSTFSTSFLSGKEVYDLAKKMKESAGI